MKRSIWILIAVLFLATGCAAVKQGSSDAKMCLADPVCREEAVAKAASVKAQAISISGMSPVPLSTNVVGGVAYGVMLLIALVKGGQKKREAEEANTSSTTKVV